MMMRLLSLFFLCFGVFSFSQKILSSDYEVIYRVKYLKDTTNLNSAVEDDVSLLIGKQNSIFKSLTKVLRDSAQLSEINRLSKLPPGSEIVFGKDKPLPIVNFTAEVFRNQDDVVVYKELINNRYSFPLENKISWTIQNEYKNIANYRCKKTIWNYQNRTYIAWFTDEIPIPEGPYVFKNLPGLIIEVADLKNYYAFSLLSFQKNQKPIVLSKVNFPVSYEKYSQVKKSLFADPIGFFYNATGRKVPENMTTYIVEKYKRANNSLD